MKISQVALKLDIFRILNNNSVSMVSVCLPSDALLQHLPSYLGFSYLGVGYLFTAAPGKYSHCSLPWTRGISLLLPFLTFNVG